LQHSRTNHIQHHTNIPLTAITHTITHNATLLAQYDYHHTAKDSTSTQRYHKTHPLRYEKPPATILFHNANKQARQTLHHLLFLPHTHPHRHNTPTCNLCSAQHPETTQHILLDCPAHNNIRKPLLQSLGTPSLTHQTDPTQAVPDLVEALHIENPDNPHPLRNLHALASHPQIIQRISPVNTFNNITPNKHKRPAPLMSLHHNTGQPKTKRKLTIPQNTNTPSPPKPTGTHNQVKTTRNWTQIIKDAIKRRNAARQRTHSHFQHDGPLGPKHNDEPPD
jgi:hypothetical protein